MSKDAIIPAAWDDMSDYVVHFTKTIGGTDDYGTMMSIYSSGYLEAMQPFGIAKSMAPNTASQNAVCFSEIPPGQWERLVKKRGTKYGIAFTKNFVVSRGGGPIWYAWKDTPHWQLLINLMNLGIQDPHAPIWGLTAMIDAPGVYGKSKYKFDWEREWRHVGRLSFKPEDVAFLMMPEELHSAASSFFEVAHQDNSGPAYLCPYIDPLWSREQILKAIL